VSDPSAETSDPAAAPAPASLWARLKAHPLARVGPGLITGVADDDPSGIATYSQAGARYGLNMLWTMPLCYPLMAAVQSMCARIGRVTGLGLAANIKAAFRRWCCGGCCCCCWWPTPSTSPPMWRPWGRWASWSPGSTGT
jgi:hypothetical protein